MNKLAKHMNKLALLNAGELYARQTELTKDPAAIGLCYDESVPFEEYQGKISAIKSFFSAPHKTIIDELITAKTSLHNIDQSDYLDFEQDFLRGYISGLELILQIDRTVFKQQINFCLVIYCDDVEDFDCYSIAANAVINSLKSQDTEHFQIRVSCDKSEIKDILDSISSEFEYSLAVIAGKKGLPSIETMNYFGSIEPNRLFLYKSVNRAGNGIVNVERVIEKIIKNSAIE